MRRWSQRPAARDALLATMDPFASAAPPRRRLKPHEVKRLLHAGPPKIGSAGSSLVCVCLDSSAIGPDPNCGHASGLKPGKRSKGQLGHERMHQPGLAVSPGGQVPCVV